MGVRSHRFDGSVVLDVHWQDGHETFFVVEGERSLGLMCFDPGDPSYREPRIVLVPKPMDLNLDGSDEELMLLVWKVLGGGR